MDELTQALHALVAEPPVEAPDLAELRTRVARNRRRRALASGAAGLAVVGAVVAVTSVLATPTAPRIDPLGPAGDETVVPTSSPDPTPTAEPSPTEPTAEPDPYAGAREVAWATDAERVAWQQENGRDGMWVSAFFLSDEQVLAGDLDGELTRWWTRIADEGDDAPREETLPLALAQLTARPPAGYSSAYAGGDLRVASVRLEGTTVNLDLPAGTTVTDNGFGSSGAYQAIRQLTALVGLYYPEADTLCLSIDGVVADQGGPMVFHDGIGCPIQLP